MANRFWVGGTGSWDATTTHWSATSGGASGATVPTAIDDVYFDANSGGGTVTVNTATRLCLSLSFRGTSGTSDFTGTFAQSGTGSINISGGLTLSASTTYTYGGAISFIGISTFSLTSNGAIWIGSNITINGLNLQINCTDTFTTTGTLTITQGLFVNFASILSIGILIVSSNALTRNISSPNLYFTGAGTLATIGATQTNFSCSVGYFWITGSQSSARTLANNGPFYPLNAVYISGAGSGSATYTSTTSVGIYTSIYINNTGGAAISFGSGIYQDIIFQSGTNAVWSNAASQTLTVQGNITLTSSQAAPTLTPAIVLTGGSIVITPQTITSAGKSFVTGAMTINDSGNGVAYTFADAFSSNAAFTITNTGAGAVNINANFSLTLVTNTLTITAGNLNVNNGANITCGLVSCLNAGVRTINMGSGTWNLTGVGIVWNFASATNTTINAQQSRILINDTSNNAITFASGNSSSFTYYTVEFARGASTGTISITSGGSGGITTTFANFINNTSTAAHTMSFTSGAILAFYKFNVKGRSSSALISLNRSVSSATNFIKLGQGIVSNADNLTIGAGQQICTPGLTWYAGAGSTGAPNSWLSGNAPSSQSLLGSGGVG